MYYINNANNRSLYHINFYGDKNGYETYIVGNLLRYVYYTSKTGLPLYRRAKKYFKFKNMRVSYNSHYNNYDLHRVANAIGTSNDSLYSLTRKYGSRSSIFTYGTNNKRVSFSYIMYRWNNNITQVEESSNTRYEHIFVVCDSSRKE